MKNVWLAAIAVIAPFGITHFSPATAIPPPPPPRMAESYNAIRQLEPFLGTWRGEQELPGGNMVEDYRRVARGPGDVIYISLGPQRSRIDYINVLVFDVEAQQLKLFLPGYRTLGNQGTSAAFVPVSLEDSNTLQWVSQDSVTFDEVIRTTVRIDGRIWHETIETLHPSGGVKYSREQEFRRTGNAEISF